MKRTTLADNIFVFIGKFCWEQRQGVARDFEGAVDG